MGKLSHPALTYEDFLRFPDDGRRYEIIGGELFVTPAPISRHQIVVKNIAFILGPHVEACRGAQILWAPLAVVLSRHDVFQPDLLVILPERASIVKEDGIHGAPDLVVEVLSPSTEERDRGIKLVAYARFGVGEYWIVDPEARRIEVHARARGELVRACEIGRGESFTSSVLLDLIVKADEVFAG